MDYSLKWWQWAIMAILILGNGVNAFMSGGRSAAIYGRLTGVAVASVVLVYVVVLVGRGVTNAVGSSTAE